MLFGSLVAEQLRDTLPNRALSRPTWLQPGVDSQMDDALLSQIDRFLQIICEAVSIEPDAPRILSHPLLQPGAAWEIPVRSLLAVFLDNTPQKSTLWTGEVFDRHVTNRPTMETKFGLVESAPDGIAMINTRPGMSRDAAVTEGLTMADWLGTVFGVEGEALERAITQVRDICNDRISFNELDRYIEQLERRDVPAAPESDWERVDAYEAWRDKELSIMVAFRLSYSTRIPGLKKV